MELQPFTYNETDIAENPPFRYFKIIISDTLRMGEGVYFIKFVYAGHKSGTDKQIQRPRAENQEERK